MEFAMPFSQDMRQQAGLTDDDQLKQQISAWQKAPTPELTGGLLKNLQPTMDKAIAAHVGQGEVKNPLMRSRARRMTLDVMQRYDPAHATRPSTYLYGQMAGLKRVARKQQQILSVPERAQLARGQLQKVQTELYDELGRDPTDDEIADRTGYSATRVRQIQGYGVPMSEGQLEGMYDEGRGFYSPAVNTFKKTNSWAEFIRSDMDPINQQILDHTLGLYGKPQLSNQQIAAKLKLTPGAISQRKAKIQAALDTESELSPFGG
jgi:DNA-directed RNA polymerase specialized sigma subunit